MKFAAHIRNYNGQETVQTVEEHCEGTARLAREYAESVDLSETAYLSGILHDIGKFSQTFDRYIRGASDASRGQIDHSYAGAKYLRQFAEQSDDKDVQKTISLIGRVILSHHGLNDWIRDDTDDTYAIRTDKDADYTEILDNYSSSGLLHDPQGTIAAAVSEVMAIRRKLRNLSGQSQEAFAFYLGMLERLLQSILIDADRTDTASFMSDSKTEKQYDTKKLWVEMQERMQTTLNGFSDKDDSISKQRRSISDRCAAFASHKVGICKMIVPTGGGKTLSSLRFSIEYANQHPVEKIIYIAPFMSILEQNSDVIRKITGDEAFLEHHSDMLAEVSENDHELHEYELRTEKWDTPVIATTMVQFLNALFSGKSSAVRRMHRLSRAVIIIDEVQSIPLKCVYLFNLAMNFLSHVCGSTIVLCSATQPPFDLLGEFPLMLDENSSMTGDTQEDFDAFHRTELINMPNKGGYSFDEAAAFCRERFAEHGSLLLVVNTKAAAKELYLRLRDTEDAEVFHLSTSMCPQHRRECIEEMKAKLKNHEPVICVTTQLIEAGVDISFGCVVRSLAGMDNAAQAAGRCNRNGEHPGVCPVYIMHLYEEKLGNLTEIKSAQSISRELLDLPEDTDFLSVPLMTDYFRKLYQSSKEHLRYPVKTRIDQDLINLLALNRHRINANRNPHLKFCGHSKPPDSCFR